MSATLSQVNTITTKRIVPGLTDGYFKNDPLFAFLRRQRYVPWTGSDTIQENFIYGAQNGGAYVKGTPFNTARRQIVGGARFHPKYYYVNVSEALEDIEVELKGPTAVMSLVKTDMTAASLGLGAMLAIAAYNHGSASGSTPRSEHLNGLGEALQNGTTAGWTGDTFTSYGEEVRANVADALKTNIGLVSDNIGASITYRPLLHTYLSAVVGDMHPVIGVTTNRGYGFICENFQPQQRIDTIEPTIGFTGIKFLKATIVVSQYCPGADGVNDPVLGNYYNATETFFWLNPGGSGDDALIRLHISNSPLFGFGFTGFKGERGSNEVSGQILFAGNLTVRGIRYQRALYGFSQ